MMESLVSLFGGSTKLYALSYFLMLSPQGNGRIPVQTPLQGGAVPTAISFGVGVPHLNMRPVVVTAWKWPNFVVGGMAARRFYEPMISIDMQLRRQYWEVIDMSKNE